VNSTKQLDPCEKLGQFFATEHIAKEELRNIVEDCADLAELMLKTLPHNQELTVGLRKLIEAKDCFVRALVYKDI
jgi:hypothetical protein